MRGRACSRHDEGYSRPLSSVHLQYHSIAAPIPPPELLDYISSLVSSPSDLLSLALTCKSFHVVIVPRHLEFRLIRCEARWQSLWNVLAQHPTSMETISALEIIDENSSSRSIVVPKSLGLDDQVGPPSRCQSHRMAPECGCADLLAAAIAKMQGLDRLCWTQDNFLRTHKVDAVVSSLLQHCPDMRELEINYRDSEDIYHLAQAPLWRLSNLTRVSVTASLRNGMSIHPSAHFPLMFEMLSKCPTLQDLRLAFETKGERIRLSALKNRHWPHLKRLVLEGNIEFPATEFVDFLRQHAPRLEVLSTELYLPAADLPTLPRLRWLFTPDMRWNAFTADRFPRLRYAAMANAHLVFQQDLAVAAAGD
ncbi:hypothetical protein C8R43DRAFT_1124594 [Mycena crocata]|nr:hypothetical protein C8R43DRAFT_1124594 [Mycena crocata]